MFVYWTMFGFPALLALLTGARQRVATSRNSLALGLMFVVFVVLIGLRSEVGTDWNNYQIIVDATSYLPLTQALTVSDPAFALLAWVCTRLGVGFYGPSFVCGLLLMIGVVRFCRRQPEMWLALCAAVPYLLVVVGMGYVRQGAAIGLVLIAILHFERGSLFKFALWMTLASLFHVTAVFIVIIATIAILRKRPLFLVPVALGGALLYFGLLRARFESLFYVYGENQIDSSGTIIRLMMNAVPAALLLIYYRRLEMSPNAKLLWLQFAVYSFLLMAFAALTSSTTVADRIGLYLIPIQLLIFGRLPTLMRLSPAKRPLLIYSCVLYYGAVLFVWLNFATHAGYWLPYNILGVSIVFD